MHCAKTQAQNSSARIPTSEAYTHSQQKDHLAGNSSVTCISQRACIAPRHGACDIHSSPVTHLPTQSCVLQGWCPTHLRPPACSHHAQTQAKNSSTRIPTSNLYLPACMHHAKTRRLHHPQQPIDTSANSRLRSATLMPPCICQRARIAPRHRRRTAALAYQQAKLTHNNSKRIT
jgi:hypothetical protein